MRKTSFIVLILFALSACATNETGRPRSDSPLADSYWIMQELNGQRLEFFSGDRALTLAIDDQAEQIRGKAACNRFFGGFATEEDSFKAGPLAATKMYCARPVEAMQVETNYLAAIQEATRYRIEEDKLTLFGADGGVLLEFERAHYDPANEQTP